MKTSNQEIIDKYFEAYSNKDMDGIRKVMSENVTWYFLGQHPFAGIKRGVDEVVAFFDTMGKIMMKSNPKMEKLITAENEDYFIECQHSITQREDDVNLDHFSAVLWTIKDGKITEGRHFFADPQAVDKYFSSAESIREGQVAL